MIDFADARGINHGTGTHEQQGFVQNVAERMGSCPIERQIRANSCAANHEPYLADDMIGQQTAHIIFDNGEACTI